MKEPSVQVLAREQLDSELAALNAEVETVVASRRAWMDAHMTDYARYKVGDVLFNMTTGALLGTVTRLYRYWTEHNWQYDTTMNVNYEWRTTPEGQPYPCFDNSSRQPGLSYGTAEEYEAQFRGRVAYARRMAMSPDQRYADVFDEPG